MTIQCRKVLNELRKLSSRTKYFSFTLYEDTHCIYVTDTDESYDYAKYENEIFGIIKQLVDDGYLEYTLNQYYFYLTHKGIHIFQFQWDACKSFLFNSILVPIFVSVVTTLLTILIKGLL